MTALIQNFSIPADDDVQVTLQIEPTVDLTTLDGCTIVWRVYQQQFGIPMPAESPPALIEKSTDDGSIELLPSPPPTECQININRADTVNLLRNYYHETLLIDVANHQSRLNCGIMTVTDTRIR